MTFAAARTAAAALSLGLLAGTALGEARAAALYTFSGVVESGVASAGAFGLAADTDLAGLAFSGELRIGGVVGQNDDLPFSDSASLEFTAARFTLRLDGLPGAPSETLDAEPDLHTLDVGNGVNPRFGLPPSGPDFLLLAAGAPFSTGYFLALLLSLDDILPGGGPGAAFSAAANGTTTFGGLSMGGVIGPGDSVGFDLEASQFAFALAAIPAPGAAGLLGAGLLGLVGLRRRGRHAAA